jgi:hypothetical protein
VKLILICQYFWRARGCVLNFSLSFPEGRDRDRRENFSSGNPLSKPDDGHTDDWDS